MLYIFIVMLFMDQPPPPLLLVSCNNNNNMGCFHISPECVLYALWVHKWIRKNIVE